MDKEIRQLVENIKELIDSLARIAEMNIKAKKIPLKSRAKDKGAAGGLKMLIDEGYFLEPRDLGSIINKLKELRRHYNTSTIAMNLLNFTKRRILRRLRNSKQGKWEYVENN